MTALALCSPTALSLAPAAAAEAEPPGKPRVGILTGGDGQVTVAFVAPTPGSSPITGYRVSSANLTDPTEIVPPVDGASSPITVTGLTNGQSYSFRVTALSASGDTESDPSTPLNVGIVPSFPGVPSTLPPGRVGESYSYTIEAAGVPTPTVTWVQSGTSFIPDGLSYDFTTRTISGTPTQAGSFEPSFEAHNALGWASLNPAFVIAERAGEPSPAPTPPSPSPSPSPSPAPAPPGQAQPPVARHAVDHRAEAALGGARALPPARSRTLPATGPDATLPFALGIVAFTLGLALMGAYSKNGAGHRRWR